MRRNKLKPKNDNCFKLFGSIFMAAGLLMMGITLHLFFNNSTERNNAVKCQGTIVSFVHNNPVISFEYDGQIFSKVFSETYSWWHEGKKLDVFYNSIEDKAYISSMDFVEIFVCFGFAIISCLIGIISYTLENKKQKKYIRLKNKGIRLECIIRDIYIHNEVYINGSHPITITCNYKNPNGIDYRFKSHKIIVDSYDSFCKGDSLIVYADKNNYGDYFVDIGF